MIKFSVLMSIYHKENSEYLNSSIGSIWDKQTLKPDEIVLVEDGKLNDELYFVIRAWKKKLSNRLVIVKLEENIGLARALNVGLKFCSHDLIARMDSDDISLPNRFELQIKYMTQNKQVVACGSYIEEFNRNIISKVVFPVDKDSIRKFIKLRSPICHPSVVFRKDIILKVGGYPDIRLCQDYALWSILLSKGYTITNVPQVLLRFRINDDFFRRRGFDSFKYEVIVIWIQYKEGIINLFDFIKAFCLRFMLRLSPVFIKKIAYRSLRK